MKKNEAGCRHHHHRRRRRCFNIIGSVSRDSIRCVNMNAFMHIHADDDKNNEIPFSKERYVNG